MKGRSSSKHVKINKVCKSMEKRKVDKVIKEEPHLSGAYIRSLVKHLSSTRTKDSLNGDEKVLENLNTNGQCFSDPDNIMQQQESSPPPPPIKKQVRRRQHTSKPYQERLLNMAEARKEIVTALKFHRASMKQQEAAAINHDDLESKQSLGYSGSNISTTLEAYPSTTKLPNYHLDHHPSLSCPPSFPCYWPISTISPPPLPPPYHDNLNIVLPNAPLGLNLNIQDFHNLETNLYHNPLSNYSTSSSLSLTSSCSSSSSCASSSAVTATLSEEVVTPSTTTSSGGANTDGGGLHYAMDDEEMEEIRSLGEQHQMEWNDTVNLVMSAQWLEFLKTIDIGQEAGNDSHQYDYDDFSPFDQIMEFPPWQHGH
uniref:uncharacterized protein LOC122598666 n=1 Tax=Erigeron canadensis TaxID=72917 RepID=UPI001CB89550|nr:uncharacterized protein LOC122598666 [Erigeron canadensis]